MQSLPANQTSESTHLSSERVEHRDWIGGRIITLLSHYWREDDPVELTAAIGKDWAEVLEGLPQDAIAKACTQYLREETYKPKPADIYKRARQFVPKPVLVKPEDPEREPRVTAQRKAEISAELGYGHLPSVQSALKRPKPMESHNQTQQNVNKAREGYGG